ncbi:hypothetical protein BC940DRAFT_331514 [Gongronella butleri]|nr:hypothetical protein BC940DRAFT_331514 [Gongronella butleri]
MSDESGSPQLQTYRQDFHHLCILTGMKGIVIPDNLRQAYRNYLFQLVQKGLLSNSGRPKKIVNQLELNHAIKFALLEPVMHRSVPYQLQLVTLMLTVFYTGVRLGSIVPSQKFLQNDWRSVTWKDVVVGRQGQDTQGDILYCRIQFHRLKCQEFVVNMRNREYARTVVSPDTENGAPMDLPLMFIVLATLRGAAVVGGYEWYQSNLALFEIKPEWRDIAVFCESENEGTASTLTTKVWNTNYAAKAINKFFKHGNLAGDLNAYCLRRGYIQAVNRHLNPAQACKYTGHVPGSLVPFQFYGSSGAELNNTALMFKGEIAYFGDDELNLLQGNISLADYNERHLTTKERQELILDKLTKEDQALNDFESALEKKYGAFYDMDDLSEEDASNWHRLFRQRTNRLGQLSRKAMADKLNKLNQERRHKDWQVDESCNLVPVSHTCKKRAALSNSLEQRKRVRPTTYELVEDDLEIEFDNDEDIDQANGRLAQHDFIPLPLERRLHPRFKMLVHLLTLNEKIAAHGVISAITLLDRCKRPSS